MSGIGAARGTFAQDFLAGGGLIAIDSERHLRCLSLKSTLKFIIRGTTSSTPVSGLAPKEGVSTVESCSVLAAEEDAEVEVGGDSSGGASTF
ncbi:hypothetical protein PVL29_006268 [Vitis rotundifolia]|uniref:Uncharacterized protein n=1 Tax=Vitis rotundifolia TaxID=103349 RepID=A0AA39A5L1_VITRO|nr:hypothetical protein PVL29_006268 [Vitis rotundifolia]